MAENQTDQSQSRRRRRDGSSGAQQRLCSHCGRSFKRSEHLERHVRTHTKEKPYVCHCGSAYSRRDLLTRHQRITHETLSPRSPDAPASEDSHQLPASDSDPPPEDAVPSAAVSISDMSIEHGLPQQHPYSSSGHGFVLHNQPAGLAYHPLVSGQELYGNGQQYAGFDQFQEFNSFAEGASLPSDWSFFHDPNGPGLEQDLVDPALRGSMVDASSPLSHDSFAAHAHNTWMSPAAQKWSN
ncbi:hypothetical protein GGS23DRAFT_498843 [Durotheca rogersii]|uniref:uncharacterized protein n=1 Tax=Durotheca rogersii TaxID=419775 RepID=UPI00221FEF67|nr:uncharacterized protein GGS23DRAFT_498843 [Durotheca rogersii]KAI5864425.1 hypothetical protein GGS23DRAFT_498843 [Durotheca rogersii]